MSCALPLVTSRIEGVTDWICDYGRCGITVSKMDIAGFADALEMLAKHPEKREELGKDGRKRIMALASFEAHGKAYAELVRKIARETDYEVVTPHCELAHYVQPEFLKSWGPARILPMWLKVWLRRFM